MRPLGALDEAWAMGSPGARLEAVTRAAPILRDAIASSGLPRRVETFDVATFPYPTEFAFSGVCSIPVPYVWLFNRALYVEYLDRDGETRRLLVNPSRPEGNKKAPFFQSMFDNVPPPLQPHLERVLSRQAPPVEEQLAAAGVDPASIDYVTFDHLHVQDVAPLLGDGGLYPRAKLLVTRAELSATRRLHPLQVFWYVEGGLSGIPEDRFEVFDRDLLLGEGVALVRTPGHTDGNHTIVVATGNGLVTISENGVAADCYAPRESKIPGLRAHAEKRGVDFILNANTRERTLDQYTSMQLEAALSARANSPVPGHFCSSELTVSAMAPLVKPTFSVGAITSLAPGAS